MVENVNAAKPADIFPWELLLQLAKYRSPRPVTEYLLHVDSLGCRSCYYICPRCDITLEREFQTCCDRCGQLLDWKGYRKAKRRLR